MIESAVTLLLQYTACAVIGDGTFIGIHTEKVAAFVEWLVLDVVVSQACDDFVLEGSKEAGEELVCGFAGVA